MSGDRNVTFEPGGCDCHECGCIFIGEPWHTLCRDCNEALKAKLAECHAGRGERSRASAQGAEAEGRSTGNSTTSSAQTPSQPPQGGDQ